MSADSNLRKANLFNDYFISVFTGNTLDVQLGESDSKLPDGRVASDYQINRDVVYNVLSNLDISKSRGEDQLPPVFLRRLATELTPSVFNVFRNIHRLDTFPEKWKLGIVSPFFKKGKKSEISNYRPVTLLNIVSKCFEKIVFSQIADHFIKYVNSAQFGFLPRKSAILQLLHCLNYIYASIPEKDIASCLVMFDFSKAFDKISHTVLLQKIRNVGIEGKLLKILRSYLTNRSQRVRINAILSAVRLVLSGVPQGSLLGPILFLIFINDLPDKIFNSVAFIFADDLKTFFDKSPDLFHLLTADLDRLSTWSTENRLPFNISKCCVIDFKNCYPCDITFCNTTLDLVSSVNDLGLQINITLSWTEHIKKKLTKANATFFLIRRSVSHLLSPQVKLHLYKTLLMPIILYASQCWSPNKLDLKQLETFQKRVVRWMLPDTPYRDAISSLVILPIAYFAVLTDFLTLSKIVSGLFD